MAIVVSSYRQTVRAYPGGGGAYIVSKENLGVFAGLVAAAALLFDYMMTVVVSIVGGRLRHRFGVPLGEPTQGVAVVGVRRAHHSGEPPRDEGVRDLFAVPTYGFVLSIYVLLSGRLCSVPRRVPDGGAGIRADRGAGRRCRHHDLRHLEGVLAGGDGAHRRRGDLRRRPRLQTAASQERGRHAGDHGHHRDHDVPRDLLPDGPRERRRRQRESLRGRPARASRSSGTRPSGSMCSRRSPRRSSSLPPTRRTRTSRDCPPSLREIGTCRASS